MLNTPYTKEELEIKRTSVQKKLLEARSNLKTIRDVAEIKPEFKVSNLDTGNIFDKKA